MSEVAGRMATQEGVSILEKHLEVVSFWGVIGVRPAKAMIIGGGVAGTEAALMAVAWSKRFNI